MTSKKVKDNDRKQTHEWDECNHFSLSKAAGNWEVTHGSLPKTKGASSMVDERTGF